MTDAVAFGIAPAGDVIALDIWADEGAAILADVDCIRVEPRRWWLFGCAAQAGAIAERLADNGALAPIGGGLICATLTGPGWRGLLMVSGVFDAEGAGFGTGAVAATIIHHVPVWIIVDSDSECRVFFAASYAGGLVDLWTQAIAGGLA